tara:strand:+ start:1307 stop:1510 length:204 start_codon:yes stop_codon:yes gene_type:complete
MDEIIEQLKNMNFVTGLRNKSCNIESSSKHLIIEIENGLIIEKNSIPKIYKLLKSQSFFEWTIVMAY